MQTQFLSNKDVDPIKPSHQSITLPDINNRNDTEKKPLGDSGPQEQYQKSVTGQSSNPSKTYLTNNPIKGTQFQIGSPHSYEQGNLLGGAANARMIAMKSSKYNKSKRSLAARPLIHIREGKLLISGRPKN